MFHRVSFVAGMDLPVPSSASNMPRNKALWCVKFASFEQRRSSEVSPQTCHHGRDLGSPLRSRDQAAEQAVEACHFADASQVSQDCLCWQSHDVGILG